MNNQISLIPDLDRAEKLRDKGMKQATEHANQVHENWSDKAYAFLLKFIKTKKKFLTEELREESYKEVPFPPSERAWGSIVVKAKNNKLIKAIGFRSVKNPRAHKTPATLWQVIV